MEAALVQRTTRASAPESIDDDLRALWRTVSRERPVARAVMANLIVFVSDADARNGDVPIDDVVRRHPSRVVVLRHVRGDAAERPPSGASVSIVSFGPPHARYAVEEIALRASCGDTSLPSIVRRVTRGDLPTSLWWTEDFSRAAPILALTRMARLLVFDSSRWRDVGRAVAAIAPVLHDENPPRLADINWRRLAAVRHALVDAARALPSPAALPRLEIRYRPGEAALAWLLAGWFAARLGWPDDAWPAELQETRHGDDVLSVSAAPVTVTMNGQTVVARSGGGAPIFHLGSYSESTAAAVAAELATLPQDPCLKEALVALARQRAIG